MSTIQDYRRTDLRVDSSRGAFWLTSKAIDGHEVSGLKDKACVLFSFPIADQQIIIREIVVRVLTPFTTGTTLELGSYTLATEDVSTDGTATAVDDNACTLNGTPVLEQVFGSAWTEATTAGSTGPNTWANIDGSLIIKPNSYVAFYSFAANTAAFICSILWEEVDV
jgi:hypothetical protein